MPLLMKRMYPARRSSLALVSCFALGACELAKRDFADVPSGETSEGAAGSDGTPAAPTSERSEPAATESAAALSTAGSHSEALLETSGQLSSEAQGIPTGGTDSTPPSNDTDANPNTTGMGAANSSELHDTTLPEPVTDSLCDQNILENGNFEAGATGWTATSSYSAFEQRVHPLIVPNEHESLANYSVTAHDGTQFAYLGDVPDDEYMGYNTTLTRSVYVPEEASGLALVGYAWIETAEPADQEWDIGYIQLELPDNTQDYWQLTYWSNLDATTGWVKFDAYTDDVAALRGKHVNVVLQAVTDANTPTRYWFDDLELIVVCRE